MRTIIQGLGIAAILLGSSLSHAAKPQVCQSYRLYEAQADGKPPGVIAVCFDAQKPRLITGNWSIVTLSGGVKVIVEERP